MTASKPIPLSTVVARFAYSAWGYTGTRAGMTEFQGETVRRMIASGQPKVFRHGGAIGGDTQAHLAWKRASISGTARVLPASPQRAEMFRHQERVIVEAVRDPLTRNVLIVDVSEFMIAAPHKEHEEQRSGTWHTIREAMRTHTPVLIIWPLTQRLTLHMEGQLIRVSYRVRDKTAVL